MSKFEITIICLIGIICYGLYTNHQTREICKSNGGYIMKLSNQYECVKINGIEIISMDKSDD